MYLLWQLTNCVFTNNICTCSQVVIPWTGYIEFATKVVINRKKRRRSIKIKFLCEKLFYLTRYLNKIGTGYCLRQWCNLRRHLSDQYSNTSCHTNWWPIKIKFLYGSIFICEGYSSFGATEVNVFSCFYCFRCHFVFRSLKSQRVTNVTC